MKRSLLTIVTVCLGGAILLGITAGCDGDGSRSAESPSPTASGPPDLSPRVGGVEAAGQYLKETGIDGDEGDFTDPRDCAQVNDDTKGEFCVHENFSTYAPGLVILRIARGDNPSEKVWEMRLLLTDGKWEVQSVEPFGVSE